jgi:hypothetical protein
MRIIWNQNPLASVVELDNFDRQILRLKIEVAALRDRMYEAHFDIDPEQRKWRNEHTDKKRTLEESVAAALVSLDVGWTDGEGMRDGKTWDQWLDAEVEEYVAELAGVHGGDCTCVACSCLKCRAESLFGTNTIEGLGKHGGSYVDSVFRPKDGRVPTLDEAIASLRDYKPVRSEAWGKRDNFDAHVPRWTAEAKSAHAWLVSYKAAHFGAVPGGE